MSIEAKDLRLGNYVNEQYWDSVDGCFKFAKIVVDGIYKKHIVCENNGAYNLDDIQPIPLTENWLVRCGFEFGIKLENFTKGKHQFIELDCLNGYFSESGIFYYGLNTEIKYLHQLQNLYWCLCGEELKIIL